jgi:hypothetical protein
MAEPPDDLLEDPPEEKPLPEPDPFEPDKGAT